MDRLARLVAGTALLVSAACGAAAPSAGTGVPLPPRSTSKAPATGLRTARALSKGSLTYATAYAPAGDQLLTRTLLPWLDPNVRQLLDQGSRFSLCPAFEPASAEHLEEVACSWDG